MDSDTKLYFCVVQASRKENGGTNVAIVCLSAMSPLPEYVVREAFIQDATEKFYAKQGAGFTLDQIAIQAVKDESIEAYVMLRYGVDLSEVRNGA